MRRGIYLLAVLVLCTAFCGYSKSVTEDNYVRTWVYLDSTGNDSRARISTDPGVDANGDTIVKNINRYKSVSHTYLGSFDYDGYYSGFRIVTPVGLYDSKAKKHYWNITNHHGSVMAVVDSDGKVAQRSGLYPSGTPFTLPVDFAADTVTMRAGAIDERLHIGNRWLSHSGLNWYDNTARMHDPLLCRFTTPDPLATDYTSSSPWTHCLANPANILDPTGMDNWQLDGRGYFILKEQTDDDFDVIFGRNDAKLQVEKGATNAMINVFENPKNSSGEVINTPTSIYKIKNNAVEIFEFLALNSDVEWSLFSFSDTDYSLLGTTHYVNGDNTPIYIENNLLEYNSTSKFYHSHTITSTASNSDRSYVERMNNNGINPVTQIFYTPTKSYYTYTSTSSDIAEYTCKPPSTSKKFDNRSIFFNWIKNHTSPIPKNLELR